MRIRRRVLSLLLSVLMVFGSVQMPASAAINKEGDVRNAEYRKGLFERFTNHLGNVNSVYDLMNNSGFGYIAGTTFVKDTSWGGKAFLWGTHKLTDKEINTQAYVEELSKILAMMEKGFLETTQAQGTYTAEENVGKDLKDIAETTVGELLGADTLGELGKLLKEAADLLELGKISAEGLKSSVEAAILMTYEENYRQKIAFLEAVRDHTEDKKLKAAANDLIQSSGYELLYVLDNYKLEASLAAANLTWDMGSASNQDIIEGVSTGIANGIGPWLDKLCAKLGKKAISGTVLAGAKMTATVASSVLVGFEIGGTVAKIACGKDVEMFREMLVMDSVGEALNKALYEYTEKGMHGKSNTERYDNIYKTVSCGEALVYVRLRGEYCAVEALRDKEGAYEELEGVYANTVDRLARGYHALSIIFPESVRQVTVYTTQEKIRMDYATGWSTTPAVYIAGREDVTEKINQSSWIRDYVAEFESQIETMNSNRLQMPGWDFKSTGSIQMNYAYATKEAVSICMSKNLFPMGGAHGDYKQSSVTFDLTTGERLKLSDLLNPDNVDAAKNLKKLVSAQLNQEQSGMAGMFMTADEAAEKFILAKDSEDENWTLTEDGLRFHFQPYEIAPYAGGIIQVTVPYRKLSEVIQEKYLPEEHTSEKTENTVVLMNQAQLLEEAAYTTNPNLKVYGKAATSVYAVVNPQGLSYDVSVKNSSDGILYYTNLMGEEDLVWLPDQDERSSYTVWSYLKNEKENTQKKIGVRYVIKNGTYREEAPY